MLRGELGTEPLCEVDTLEEDHIEAEEGRAAGLCSLPAQGCLVSFPDFDNRSRTCKFGRLRKVSNAAVRLWILPFDKKRIRALT